MKVKVKAMSKEVEAAIQAANELEEAYRNTIRLMAKTIRRFQRREHRLFRLATKASKQAGKESGQ